jgi:putative phosphoesterase
MKIIVFSDAHGNKGIINRIINYNPDADFIISLGDSEVDYQFLLDLDILAIKGNYPRDPGFAYEGELKVEDKTIFMTHGHKYGVHRKLSKLASHALKKEYDLVLYGHTHIAQIDRVGTTILVNPGSIKSPRNAIPPSYLVITVEEGEFKFKFKEANTNELIKEA